MSHTHVTKKHQSTLKHKLGNVAKGAGALYLGYSAALGAHYDYKTTKAAVKHVKNFVHSGGVSRVARSTGAKAINTTSSVRKWASGGGPAATFNAVKNSAGRFGRMGGRVASMAADSVGNIGG